MSKEKIYEGKAKILYRTEESGEIIQYFKDDATAFNNIKKDHIFGKGILNNIISEHIMLFLEQNCIPTHFIARLDDRTQLVKKLSILPLEVIVRNQAAGSICKRLRLKEGQKFDKAIIEFCLKDDKLNDPVINEDHIINVLNIATEEEISLIKAITFKINELLIKKFSDININLIDFKIEFGKDENGNVFLADEISPDSCRLWDSKSLEKMDKDRFRLDLGSLVEYYTEIATRFSLTLPDLSNT